MKISRQKVILAVCLFVLIFAVTCYVSVNPSKGLSGEASGRYTWQKELTYYSYKTSVKSVMNLQGSKIPSDVAIDALLNVKIFDVYDDYVEIGIYGSPVSVINNGMSEASLEYIYKIPVLIKVAKNGRFLETHFPSNTSEKQRFALRGFYAPLEMVLEPMEAYNEQQTDSAGTFTASYTVSDAYVEMRKLNYISLKKTDIGFVNAEAFINGSEYKFAAGEGRSWLDFVTGGESVKYKKKSGETVVDSELTVMLKSLNERSGDDPDYFKDMSFAEALAGFEKGVHIYKSTPAVKIVKKLQKPESSVEESEFELYLRGLGEKNAREISLRMRDVLLRNPEKIQTIPSMILDGRLNDNQAKELINILGIIGIDEAQRALIDITSDVAQSDNNRLRAVISFTSLKQPVIEDVRELFFSRITNIDPADGAIGLYTSSVLVLGAISKNLSEDYPLEAKELSDELKSHLSVGTSLQQKYILKSLGNTYNEEYSPLISSYIKSEVSEVRKAAVESLKYMNDEESENALRDQFVIEPDGNIRYSIVKTLGARDINEETLSAVTSAAPLEKDIDTRRGIIDIIDSHIQKYPETRATLEEMLKTETSEVNIKKILKAAGKSAD